MGQEILLTKKTYRAVLKDLARFKEKNFDTDRRENPHSIIPAYGASLEMMIESICREHHERCPKGHAMRVLDHLADKGLLVRYVGDFTFPSDEPLPSESEIARIAKTTLDSLPRLRNLQSP